jgi:arylsulfatase A-like enzyme
MKDHESGVEGLMLEVSLERAILALRPQAAVAESRGRTLDLSRCLFSARRWISLALSIGICVCALLGCSAPPEPYDGHVLLLTVDALRPDYMSMNGYDRPTTPFLDSLVAGGHYFEGAISPVPRTTPAVASLLTGAYPHSTAVRKLADPLGQEAVSMAEYMSSIGYQTMAVVTNTLLVEERGFAQGFDIYDWNGDWRIATTTTKRALSLLDEMDPNRPVFAWVHYIDPHAPYHTDPNLILLMDPDYTGRYERGFGWGGYPGAPTRPHSAFPEDLPKSEATHRNPLPEEVNEHIRRLYAADILFTDSQIRRLVEALHARLGEEWIVIFTSDHGESFGEHDHYFDHGDYVYNEALRVPLSVTLPESHPLRGSGRCSGWVSLVDVVPTLFDLIGREPPAEMAAVMEGRSLAACMRGEKLRPAPVFAESGHSFYPGLVRRRQRNDVAGRFRTVYLDEWKLIWTPFLPEEEAWELYHVATDPEESLDLYSPDLPVVSVLEEHLKAWLEKAKAEPEARPLSDADMEALRSLGYVE